MDANELSSEDLRENEELDKKIVYRGGKHKGVAWFSFGLTTVVQLVGLVIYFTLLSSRVARLEEKITLTEVNAARIMLNREQIIILQNATKEIPPAWFLKKVEECCARIDNEIGKHRWTK